VGAGGVLAIGSGGVTLSRTLNNGGSVSWSGGNLTFSAGNTVNNQAGGTFDITADGRLSGAASTPINNAGVFRLLAGSAGTTVLAPFNNSGQVQVQASTLELNLGGNHTGTCSTAPGSTLRFGGGTHVLNAGSVVAGSGTLSLAGAALLTASGTFNPGTILSVGGGVATLTAGCDLTGSLLSISGNGVALYNSGGSVAAVTLTGGTLGGSSSVKITGTLTLNGGSVTNALVTAEGGLAITGNATLNGGKLVNVATALWSAGNLTGANGAVVSNLFGASFINTFDGNMPSGSGATPLFVNAGTFAKTNGTAALGTTSIDFQFINTGTVEVQTNTLRYGINQQIAGTTLLDGGSLSAQAQPLQILGGSLVGGGALTVANAQNVINGSSISPGLPLGQLDISGNYQQTAAGTLNIDLGGYVPGSSFDLVTVTAGGAGGVASLAGTLQVALTNGFTPTNGATFTFLTASSRAGSFASFLYPSNDIGMQVSYDATSVTLKVTNLKPVVVNPIPDPAAVAYGASFNYSFAANTFSDPDGDALTYTASGLPPGITFTAATRTFAGLPTQAGDFLVTVTASDSGIPSLSATNQFTITVTPATLNVVAEAKAKTYSAADPALTYTVSGLQFTDTAASVLTGTLTRTTGETVAGSPYAITQGTLAASGNYTLAFTGNSLSIGAATLTVTAQAKAKTYGAADPALTYTVSGLQFTDTVASVLTGTLTRTTGETVAGSPYAITQGTLAASGNYTLAFIGNSLSIGAATLTVTAQAKAKTYGAADPALTYTVSGLQFTDTAASVLTGTLTRTTGETVAGSPYAITQGNLAANGNYLISFTSAALSITKAPLAVTADSLSKAFGATDPAFTVSYVTFVNSESASVLGGQLVITRAAGEAPGTYVITPSGLTSSNYAITFETGLLTIAAPGPKILSLTRATPTTVLLTWTAVTNANYRVQFKSDLNATNWADLAGDVQASADTASKSDTVTPGNRFYRVQVLP